MSELLSGSERLDEGGGATDVELIDAVRSGDTQAYGTLFDRHREAAMRLARQLVRGPDADDLVAESFIRVLATLQNGKGPDEFFRAYLLTAIRRLHVDRLRAEQRTRPTGDESELDREVEFVDPAEMHFEQGAAAAAFAALPERWQLVLWHLDVEGNKPADIAPLLGMSPNSVSALAYRAREGLRQAYLQQHLAPALRGECRTTTGLLGAYVRDGLSKRDAKKVDLHLEDCSRCAGLHLELVEVNGNLSGLIGPALLGPAFAGYAAAGAGASSAALGLKLLVAPVKSLSASVSGSAVQGVVAAAVVTSVAAAGTIAVTTDFNTAGQRTSVTAAGPADTPASTDPSGSSPVVDEAAAPRAPRTSSAPTTPIPGIPSGAVAPGTTTPSAPAAVVPTATPETGAPPSSPAPPGRPTPTPTPSEPPEPAVTPTDYGVTAPAITSDDTFLQRRFTVPITAANAGRPVDQAVTVTMRFTQRVTFRGVASGGWDCGSATRNERLSELVCTTTLPAGHGTTFIAKARGLLPAGSITVTATDDPHPGNDSVSFQSPPYQYVG